MSTKVVLLAIVLCLFSFSSFCFNNSNNGSVYWDVSKGLPDRQVHSACSDVYGNYWLGFSSGIYLFTGATFISLSDLLENGEVLAGNSFALTQGDSSTLFYASSSRFLYKISVSLTSPGKLVLTKIYDFNGQVISGKLFCNDGVLRAWSIEYYFEFDYIRLVGEYVLRNPNHKYLYSYNGTLITLYGADSAKVGSGANAKWFIAKRGEFIRDISTLKTNVVDQLYFNQNLVWSFNSSLIQTLSTLVFPISLGNVKDTIKSKDIVQFVKSSNSDILVCTNKGLLILRDNDAFIYSLDFNRNCRGISIDFKTGNKFVAYYNGIAFFDKENILIKDTTFAKGFYREVHTIGCNSVFIPEGLNVPFLLGDLKTGKLFELNFSATNIYPSMALVNDSTWLVFSDSLYLFNFKQNKLFPSGVFKNPFKHQVRIYSNLHKQYLIVSEHGLYLMNNLKGNIRKLALGNFKSAVLVDDYWFAALDNGTIFKITRDGNVLPWFEKSSTQFSNIYEIIYVKRNKSLWLATNNGLYLFDPTFKQLVSKLGKREGFADDEFNSYSYFIKNTDLIIGGMYGVNYFNTDNYLFNRIEKPIVVEILTSSSHKDFRLLCFINKKLIIDNQFRNLRFYISNYFLGTSLLNIEANGISTINTLGNKNEIDFYNLPVGDHIFSIIYPNSKFDSFKSLPFFFLKIRYPWYLRFWAILLWVSSFFFFFFLFYSYRKGKLESAYLFKIEENRQQLYRIIAHDLRSPVNNFTNLLTTVEFLIKNQRTKDLAVITNELNKSALSVNLILKNLLHLGSNQNRDYFSQRHKINIEKVFLDLCHAYSLIAETKCIQFTYCFKGPSFIFIQELPLQLLLRNLIDNSIKHSSTEIAIDFTVNSSATSFLLKLSNDFEDSKLATLTKLQNHINSRLSIETGTLGHGLGMVLMYNSLKHFHSKIKLSIINNFVSASLIVKI